MPTTRDRLIKAAADLLDEGGPAAVTLREVGRRADVSHNTPYKHFADKRDLLATVAAGELRRLARDIARADGEHVARLEAAALTYIRWARTHPARFKLTFGSWNGVHEELDAAATAARTAMDDSVAAAGLPGDPARTASLVWALAHGLVDLDISGHLRKAPDAPDTDELVRAFVAALERAE